MNPLTRRGLIAGIGGATIGATLDKPAATPRRPATSRPQEPSPTAPAGGSARACAGAGALQLGHKPTRVADAVTPARAAGADATSPPPALHGSKRFAVLSCSTAAPHGSGSTAVLSSNS